MMVWVDVLLLASFRAIFQRMKEDVNFSANGWMFVRFIWYPNNIMSFGVGPDSSS